MCDKAGVNLKTLQKNGGKVYIQGVLQGYSISKGGSKRNVTERCYTYKQMSNTRNTRRVNGSTWYGIGWPASCNEGWRARYDIAVEYKKVEAPVTINYYQSYEGKWKLVLSVTNSDDGKIEKNPATRNLNKANTGYQWSSTSGSGSIASGDRGLGLEKKYYISLSEIKTSSKSLPARLSSVGAGEGKTSNYYLYKTFVSKQKSKKNGAIRNKVAKTSAPVFKSCNFADKDGNLTASYTKWLKTARQTFEVYNGGTVINVLYKKNSLKPKPDSHEDEDVISVEKLTPASTSAVIQSDKRDNEQFDSTQGIPTSETQYVNVFTDSYLYKYRFVRKYTEEDAIARDITQDTFIRLYERRRDFDVPEKAKSFIYITARNLCLDHLKHQKIKQQYQQTQSVSEAKDPDFLHEITYQETLRILHQAIDTLPPQTRKIILLGLNGKNNNEIAEALNISVNTVKSLKKSAYTSLRGQLKDPMLFLLFLLIG